MVAINEIPLPECAGEGCGGDSDICTDSRVHHRNTENRVPATRNHRRTVAFGRWLTRDPIGYRGGINIYGYVSSSPVGRVDAEGLAAPDNHSVTLGQIKATLDLLGKISRTARAGANAIGRIKKAITVVRALKGSPGAQRELVAEVLDDLKDKAEDVIRDAGGTAGQLANAELNADIDEIKVAVDIASSVGDLANLKSACMICRETSLNKPSTGEWVTNRHLQIFAGGYYNLSNYAGLSIFGWSILIKWRVRCAQSNCRLWAYMVTPTNHGNGVKYVWVPCDFAG
jgi:hypothetical protein